MIRKLAVIIENLLIVKCHDITNKDDDKYTPTKDEIPQVRGLCYMGEHQEELNVSANKRIFPLTFQAPD